MSSITTAVPTGALHLYDLCIIELYNDIIVTTINPSKTECANATRRTKPQDFETICCNGMITDQTQDLYAYPQPANLSEQVVYLSNLVCCGVQGP